MLLETNFKQCGIDFVSSCVTCLHRVGKRSPGWWEILGFVRYDTNWCDVHKIHVKPYLSCRHSTLDPSKLG